MAPTTASSLSAVLTVLTLLAAVWRPHEQWRPQPLFASADRHKFPFGGKRREREPVVPETTEPDLLDEVAGGRYGGGQTLLPTLTNSADKASERKLPRLFPDAPGADLDDLDENGFDDDLLGWTTEPSDLTDDAEISVQAAPPPPPPPPPSFGPSAGPRATPAGLVPPPPPSMPSPGDANWPREMGMLEAIANLDETAAADGGATAETEPWGAPPWGGEAAAPELPIEQTVLAPFSDLAPLEAWEQHTPPAPEPAPAVSWLSFPGESRRWSTGLEGLHRTPQDSPATDTPPVAETDSDTQSWTSWQWETSHTLSMDPEQTAWALPAAPSDTVETTEPSADGELDEPYVMDEPFAIDEPFDYHALERDEFANADFSNAEFDDAEFDDGGFDRASLETDDVPSDEFESAELETAELESAAGDPLAGADSDDGEHDRWSGVRWADPTTDDIHDVVDAPAAGAVVESASEPEIEPADAPTTLFSAPAFSFALPELTQAWDKYAEREGIDPASFDFATSYDTDLAPTADHTDDVAHELEITPLGSAPADLPEPQTATSSWSDIFDIFQAEDDPSDPDDLLEADDDDLAEPVVGWGLSEDSPVELVRDRSNDTDSNDTDSNDTDSHDTFAGDAFTSETEGFDDELFAEIRGASDIEFEAPLIDAPLVDAPMVASAVAAPTAAVAETGADGDRWASTLLDRLRAVVATPAEPVEALAEFNERFERGLRLRLTEQQVIDYLGQGVQMIAPEAEAHVLVGQEGSSLSELATVGQQTRPGCGVADTDMCPAIVQDETLRFDNSTFLDACPFLSARASSACAAVCVPIGETGTTRGVVHITTLLNAALPDPTVEAIERSAAQINTRLITLGATRRKASPDTSSYDAPKDEPARAYDEEAVASRV